VKWLNVVALCAAISAAVAVAAETAQLPDEHDRVLNEARTVALKYAHQLPDFICKQTTYRQVTKGSPNFLNASNMSPLRQPLSHDTFEEQLAYIGGHESYSVLSVNHRIASDADPLQFKGAISGGEFGTVFSHVFNPGSKTTFKWEKEKKINGRRVWEYRFHVPKEAGTAVIYKQTNYSQIAAYSGAIAVDPETYDVVELSSSVDVPPNSPIQKVERRIDYAIQKIGKRDFYVPVHSELHMEQGYLVYDNLIEFTNYHHFSSESTVRYGDETEH